MKRKKQKYDLSYDENLINLTPLIDVVFVVLVAFILIAPLLEVDHLNLSTSSIKSDKIIENSKIVIKVNKENSIFLNNEKISCDQLTNALKNKKKNFPNSIPQLMHDKQACFGTYQNIKNSLENAGFENIDIVLQPN
ncbi:MAG: hypothetical protein A3F40_04525 [Chlamydiae bacterium RIFCSPHIGHO2_12_FULL_27_8]|nr:MAG: hypothetical protein A3F40_04525 [Chlamydiae bacterium RIFCSPHIGHO2_12_FULL_27_8]OGN66847.1 MAG: hypothetical protein A2888_00770 [Chlamydiae bacterium RIFCSPLOWO2_01_FULL_28_7]